MTVGPDVEDERVAVQPGRLAEQLPEEGHLLGDLPPGAAFLELGLRPIRDDRPHRLFGRFLIAQQVRGRDVEDRADVVEPGRDVIVRAAGL